MNIYSEKIKLKNKTRVWRKKMQIYFFSFGSSGLEIDVKLFLSIDLPPPKSSQLYSYITSLVLTLYLLYTLFDSMTCVFLGAGDGGEGCWR